MTAQQFNNTLNTRDNANTHTLNDQNHIDARKLESMTRPDHYNLAYTQKHMFLQEVAEYVNKFQAEHHRDRSIMDQAMYERVRDALKLPRVRASTRRKRIEPDTRFRQWAQTRFKLSEDNPDVVLHEGLPVLVREKFYEVILDCHLRTRHGSREATFALIRLSWSYVPRPLVVGFMKHCPICFSEGKRLPRRERVRRSRAGEDAASPTETNGEAESIQDDEVELRAAKRQTPSVSGSDASPPLKRRRKRTLVGIEAEEFNESETNDPSATVMSLPSDFWSTLESRIPIGSFPSSVTAFDEESHPRVTENLAHDSQIIPSTETIDPDSVNWRTFQPVTKPYNMALELEALCKAPSFDISQNPWLDSISSNWNPPLGLWPSTASSPYSEYCVTSSPDAANSDIVA